MIQSFRISKSYCTPISNIKFFSQNNNIYKGAKLIKEFDEEFHANTNSKCLRQKPSKLRAVAGCLLLRMLMIQVSTYCYKLKMKKTKPNSIQTLCT